MCRLGRRELERGGAGPVFFAQVGGGRGTGGFGGRAARGKGVNVDEVGRGVGEVGVGFGEGGSAEVAPWAGGDGEEGVFEDARGDGGGVAAAAACADGGGRRTVGGGTIGVGFW